LFKNLGCLLLSFCLLRVYCWGFMLLCLFFLNCICGFFVSFIYMMPNLFFNLAYILFLWDFDFGFLLRSLHIFLTQFIFFIMFLHFLKCWFLFLLLDFVLWVFVFGFVIFFVTCFFAFLGYILPCTMMSFWGLTVFSNLCACIPVLGFCVLGWIWCGEFINDFTLCKLHCLHIVTPLICFFYCFAIFFVCIFI